MATELKPGVLEAVFAKLIVEGNNRSRLALEPLALAVEKQAKINASSGAHLYGTKTPAYPNSGPAVISGNLRRSITHTPIKLGSQGWETKVGTAVGFYPSGHGYPQTGKKTASNKYGYYLETGLKNGTKYPFLAPAFHFAMGVPAKLIYDEIYGKAWARVA